MAFLLFGVSIPLATADQNSDKEQSMNHGNIQFPMCLGRFRFALPVDITESGRSQSIYGVELSTIPISSGGVKTIWGRYLSEIKAMQFKDQKNVIIRIFELLEGVPAVWYNSNPVFSHLRRLEVMKPYYDHVLLLRYLTDEGKEALVETFARKVVDAYVTDISRGFCIGHGSIISEPGFEEDAIASFQHTTLREFTLRFESHTIDEPASEHPMSSINEFAKEFAREGVKLEIVKNDYRIVAGLKGKEGIISFEEPSKSALLRYTWHYAGAPGRADQPEITLLATGKQSDKAELEDIWNRFLQSIQQVPMAQTH